MLFQKYFFVVKKKKIWWEKYKGACVPCGSAANHNAGDTALIRRSRRSLEEKMATHPSTLAWRIPWTEDPGGPQSIRPKRVRPNLAAKQQEKCKEESKNHPKFFSLGVITFKNTYKPVFIIVPKKMNIIY